MRAAGCGTGENALHVASLGLSVLGVDVAETALAIARESDLVSEAITIGQVKEITGHTSRLIQSDCRV
jgi:2-polyprenyl-3-methyl-5-hydroxy-6-metoxy-1,4-benzoquinol methylase